MRALLLLLAACASTTPLPTTTAADLEPARFFLGTWEGQVHAADGTTATLRWTLAPGVNGTWLAGEALGVEAGVHARDFWGRTATGFVRVYLDSQRTHGLLHSSGWQGERWIWQGEAVLADGSRVPLRETIVRVDADTMTATYETGEADGSWKAFSRETLTRQRGR